MPTSGVSTFTMSRDEMIRAALRTLQALGATDIPEHEDLVDCNQALNLVLKSWQLRNVVLWTYAELAFPVVPGVVKFPIGPTAGYLTTLGVELTAEGSGGSDGTYALDITDATGTGAAGTYTILGGVVTAIDITAGGSGYSQTPTLAFPSGGISGAAATAHVVGYTTPKPIRQVHAFLRGRTSQLDFTLTPMSRQEYDLLGSKFQSGVPNQFYYDNQRDLAWVSVFTQASTLADEFHMVYQRPLEDMVNPTDNFDLPAEWLRPIKWALADELALEYGATPAVRMEIAAKAERYSEEAFSQSVEESSMFFKVGRRR